MINRRQQKTEVEKGRSRERQKHKKQDHRNTERQKDRNTETPKYIDEYDEPLGGRRASLAKTRSTASFPPSTQI